MKETIKDCFVCFLRGAKIVVPMVMVIALIGLAFSYFPATALVILGVVAFVALCMAVGVDARHPIKEEWPRTKRLGSR
jgi:ABC-type transport system involved in cytochrome bd biosynthesis fused ATPase/permease subunit